MIGTAYGMPERLWRGADALPPGSKRAGHDAPAVGPEPAAPGLGLRLKGVVKRYGARDVLRGIDLTVAPGEFVAIVGRSGCGKSTLLRLLAGLETVDAGVLAIDGQAPSVTREDSRMMFQDARLLPWKTVAGNVELGLDSADTPARARGALAQVGLPDRAHEWPAVLSGGQKQRVALARALVHAPRLLLLDEPLGALDALTRIEMQQLVETLWRDQGFTAVLVTHDVTEAVALADRVLLIEDGAIALDERIALPRPRSRGTAQWAEIQERLLDRLLRPVAAH